MTLKRKKRLDPFTIGAALLAVGAAIHQRRKYKKWKKKAKSHPNYGYYDDESESGMVNDESGSRMVDDDKRMNGGPKQRKGGKQHSKNPQLRKRNSFPSNGHRGSVEYYIQF